MKGEDMGYFSYELKTFLSNNIVKLLLLFCLSMGIIIAVVYYRDSLDKMYFNKYISYEENINKKQQTIMSQVDGYMQEFYENKKTKSQVVSNLETSAKDMENLYDSFKWKKGDEVTKELFTIKKEIILTYVQIYKNRAAAISTNVQYNEAGENEFITTLLDRYTQKDRYERIRYNIKFKT